MSETTIILSVHGGVVQDVYSSDPDVRVTLVDWDVEESDPDAPGLVEVNTLAERTERACVADFPVSPLSEMAGTDVERALNRQPGTAQGKCECEEPGHFCSGVPGILAHVEQSRLAPGYEVQRCDLCQRYSSDRAAYEKLAELGMV